MTALLFGSISSVADTSELQREAFNRAFREHGLDWEWDLDTYRRLLTGNGGQQRIADYAQQHGVEVDAAAVHATKSRIFQESLAGSGVTARPGVVDGIKEARDAGWKVGLVTTTAAENVAALLAALAPAVQESTFDVVVDLTDVAEPKPAPAAYTYALETLGEQAGACVAVEDNVGGVTAAKAAGVACVAFPNQNTAGHDFAAADRTVERIEMAELRQLV